MGEAVREASIGGGVRDALGASLFDETSVPVEDVHGLKVDLAEASLAYGLPLTSVQIEVIYSTLFRPSTELSCARVPGFSKLRFNNSDSLGSSVLLDMPTGTGKTLAMALVSILLPIVRKEDLARHSESRAGYIDYPTRACKMTVMGDPVPHPGTASVCFAPKHLVGQWAREAIRARDIASRMKVCAGFSIRVETDKLVSSMDLGEHDIALVVYNSAKMSPYKALEKGYTFGTISVDEVAENVSSSTNSARSIVGDICCGRAVYLSATFDKIHDAGLESAKGDSLIRRTLMMGFSRYDAFHLNDLDNPGYRECLESTVYNAATMAMAAVLPGYMRQRVLDSAMETLRGTDFVTMGVNYRPSLVQRVTGMMDVDLGGKTGIELFSNRYSVDISGCGNLGDITRAMEAKQQEYTDKYNRGFFFEPEVREEANRRGRVIRALHSATEDNCPVCLEAFSDADSVCIIQPCMHATCKGCSDKMTRAHMTRCPICRASVNGSLVAATSSSTEDNDGTVGHADSGSVLGKRSWSEMEGPAGFTEALIGAMDKSFAQGYIAGDVSTTLQKTLAALLQARNDVGEDKTLQVMVVCADIDLVVGGLAPGFAVLHYHVHGSVKNRVSMKKLTAVMEEFARDDGRPKLLLTRDAGGVKSDFRGGRGKSDSMTGLDFPALNAVVSVGGRNRAQRMGRLCRMSRMTATKTGLGKGAVYIELESV